MKKLTMQQIADELNCSIAQVSRALGGKPKVAPEIRQQIIDFAQAHNYRNHANCHVKHFAVITGWYNCFSSGMLNQLMLLAKPHKFRFTVLTPESMELLTEQHYDGAISISADLGKEWVQRFSIPLVEVNSGGCLFERVSSVIPDPDAEAFQAVEHLAKLGHRKIARIRVAVSPARPAEVGTKAFELAAQKFGIADSVTQCFLGPINADTIRQSLEPLVDQNYTAYIFVGSSDTESLFLPLLHSFGLRVPEDVSVIGYKNEISEFNWKYNQLTCFAFDFPALAKNVVELLYGELSGKAPAQVKVLSKLILGKTTAPPPGAVNS